MSSSPYYIKADVISARRRPQQVLTASVNSNPTRFVKTLYHCGFGTLNCLPGCCRLRRRPTRFEAVALASFSAAYVVSCRQWPLVSSPALAGSLQQNKYSKAGYICTVVCFCVIALITSERAGRCRAVGSAKRSWCDTEVFTCHSRCEWAWLPWPPPIDLF